MFSIPGFDPKTLSDNDLFEKQLDLIQKKIQAASFGKPDMINQLQTMIDAIELERRERMFNERIGVQIRSSSAIMIETDPFLKEHDLVEKVIDEKPKKSAQTRPIKIPIRTARPVTPSDGEKP
jgi:hypothetical protein